MAKLWEKTNYKQLNKVIERFLVGDDYLLDLKLTKTDIIASLAHCIMLYHIGIITLDELCQIKKELKNVLGEKDKITLSIEDEDIHSKIENILTKKLGPVGKKIHTGRSRNDQVLVAIRLFSKQELLLVEEKLLGLASSFLDFAKEHEFMPMPGYTHMQLAMPSSVGMWASSFVEAMLDEIELLRAAYNANDLCPLGSGAGYGVSLFLDRELVQNLLGFKRLQRNALYCANSRGKTESITISMLTSLAFVLNKIASDLLLFTSKEFGFFATTDDITTGSSIMPQKKNLDVLELIRAKLSTLIGFDTAAKGIISNLPSGYNRDFQETKKYLISSFDTTKDCLDCMSFVISSLSPKEDRLLKAHSSEIYAADYAYELVTTKKMPFRDAYLYAAKNLDKIKIKDHKDIVKTRNTIGSTGNLKLDDYEKAIEQKKEHLQKEISFLEKTLSDIWDK